MKAEMYRLTYESEEVLWWYHGMNQLTDLLLDQDPDLRSEDILDAGCGTGGMMERLRRRGRVIGFDLSPVALEFCRKRQLTRLLQASTTALPFKDASFDLVTSFDVLTSLPPETHALVFREFARVLRPHGHLLVRVAAYDRVRGEHDRASRVVYRYRRSGLARALQSAGYKVERITYANSVLLPVALAKRVWEARRPDTPEDEVQSDFWLPPAPVNAFLATVLRVENRIIRSGLSLPSGLSVVALARLASRG
jgi:SAM-dependent methyltransferase